MSQTEVDVRGPKDQRSSLCGILLDRGEREVEEEEDQEEELGGEDCVILNEDYDTDLELGGKRREIKGGKAIHVIIKGVMFPVIIKMRKRLGDVSHFLKEQFHNVILWLVFLYIVYQAPAASTLNLNVILIRTCIDKVKPSCHPIC